jgi:hypothetical protein
MVFEDEMRRRIERKDAERADPSSLPIQITLSTIG